MSGKKEGNGQGHTQNFNDLGGGGGYELWSGEQLQQFPVQWGLYRLTSKKSNLTI